MRRMAVAGLVSLLMLVQVATAASLSDLLGPTADLLGPLNKVTAPFEFELQRTISRGTDFPATATTPGFTYKLNPELGVYERSSVSLGSAFLDRADTVGKGRFDLGISYLHADFTEKDGDSLDGFQDVVLYSRFGGTGGFLDAAQVDFLKFDLSTDALYFSSTYGILPNLDVNLLVPLFITSLDVRQRLTTKLTGSQLTAERSDDAVGPGDVQIRLKYLLGEWSNVKGALGLAFRAPTGSEEDFQGIGDPTVTPSFVMSGSLGRLDLHGNLGFEFNADDMERSRFAYGIGTSYGVFDRLTINVDVIGTSQVTDDEVSETVAFPAAEVREINVNNIGRRFEVTPLGSHSSEVSTTLDRLDVVDIAVGLKFNLFGKVVAFASAIVPLTSDGVRADVIPAGGIEATF